MATYSKDFFCGRSERLWAMQHCCWIYRDWSESFLSVVIIDIFYYYGLNIPPVIPIHELNFLSYSLVLENVWLFCHSHSYRIFDFTKQDFRGRFLQVWRKATITERPRLFFCFLFCSCCSCDFLFCGFFSSSLFLWDLIKKKHRTKSRKNLDPHKTVNPRIAGLLAQCSFNMEEFQ